MEKIVLVVLVVLASALAGPSDPEPRPEANWLLRHEDFVNQSHSNPGIPIIFYGDSIMEAWSGQSQWTSVFTPRGAVNYGIGYDRIEHVLWRVMNGEVAGLDPKLVVLKIGTNNLRTNTDREIADGIGTIVTTLMELLPNTKILLLSILPRTGEDIYTRVATINMYISKLHDGNMVIYQNLFDHFGETWGTVSSELFSDGVHLTPAGFTLWYKIMYPWFFALCECPEPTSIGQELYYLPIHNRTSIEI